MNQKRKADLQRKLAMTSVPKPPAGLADRIKADIPDDLRSTQPQTVRRFWTSALTLRVAASLVLVFAAAYVVLHLMTRYELESVMPNVTRAKRVEPAPQSTAEVTIDLAEESKREQRAVAPAAHPAPRTAVAEVRPEEAQSQERTQPQFAPETATKMKDEAPSRNEGVAGAVVAMAPPPAPAPPATAAPAAAAPAPAAEAAAKRAASNVAAQPAGVVQSARAADLSFAPPREVFGLSIDPRAFDRVKQKIDQGERPAPGSIDVAGLVNYFAGPPNPPKREVRLDVEGSRAPSGPNEALIHFTVETPHADVAPGGSLPPAGTDADLTITLNGDAVVSHRLVGADSLKSESMLVKNTSVTGVVEVELNPAVQPLTTIATLRLHYRSAADGQPHTITKFVRASDLRRNWDSATRRHRLATLSALWSESVNGGGATHDVAQKAEKLATEAPHDARARELAAAATAFSRLQSSGPTGSGG